MKLIDVEALIDDCKKYLNTLNPNRDGKECTRIHWLIGVLSTAPTIEPEQRWIPCNEKLPSAQTEVIVSCVDDSGDTKYRYTTSGWVTTNGEYWIVDNEINPFVVAWMPMPEPKGRG